jgi:hypothetical protein
VGPIAGLDAVMKRKSPVSAGNRTTDDPAEAQRFTTELSRLLQFYVVTCNNVLVCVIVCSETQNELLLLVDSILSVRHKQMAYSLC